MPSVGLLKKAKLKCTEQKCGPALSSAASDVRGASAMFPESEVLGSFQSCAFLFFVCRSEGRKEGCVPPIEIEFATVGRRGRSSAVGVDFFTSLTFWLLRLRSC